MTTTTRPQRIRGAHQAIAEAPSSNDYDEEVDTLVDRLMERWFPNDAAHDEFATNVLRQVRDRDDVQDRSGHIEQLGLFGVGKTTCVAELLASRSKPKTLSLNETVSQAFRLMFRGRPEDHVIIDPQANAEFISRCRSLGACLPDYLLNRALLNVRKCGMHSGLDRGTGVVLSREELDAIGFAAEISAKLIKLNARMRGGESPSIDRILCDPALRSQFDTACAALAPGFSEYQYRLAVLAYRKSGRETTQRLAAVEAPEWEDNAPLRSLDPDEAPNVAGVYGIFAGRTSIFTSATLNLRNRLLRHLRVDNGACFVPPSLYDSSWRKLVVRWFAAPCDWKPRRADAVALKITRDAKSLFNLYSEAV